MIYIAKTLLAERLSNNEPDNEPDCTGNLHRLENEYDQMKRGDDERFQPTPNLRTRPDSTWTKLQLI